LHPENGTCSDPLAGRFDWYGPFGFSIATYTDEALVTFHDTVMVVAGHLTVDGALNEATVGVKLGFTVTDFGDDEPLLPTAVA
jgi:hypothetical protein